MQTNTVNTISSERTWYFKAEIPQQFREFRAAYPAFEFTCSDATEDSPVEIGSHERKIALSISAIDSEGKKQAVTGVTNFEFDDIPLSGAIADMTTDLAWISGRKDKTLEDLEFEFSDRLQVQARLVVLWSHWITPHTDSGADRF